MTSLNHFLQPCPGGNQYPLTILDGGTGTELIRMGFTNIDDDPLFSAKLLSTNPEAIKEVHKRFYKAGSDIVVTATYQASIEGLQKYIEITSQQAYELIKKGVSLAKQAAQEVQSECPDRKLLLVAGSVGPYGACLHDGSEYRGDYIGKISIDDLKAWHQPRIKLLMEAGVDLLAIETIPCLAEALAIIDIMNEIPGCRGWITFSCKDGKHTCSGDNFSESINQVMMSKCVVAAGLNCTSPIYVTDLLDTLRPYSVVKPIIVKPNSGEMWDTSHKWHGGVKNVSELAKVWVKNGASWLGGCCRVYPEDITKLKSAVMNL